MARSGRRWWVGKCVFPILMISDCIVFSWMTYMLCFEFWESPVQFKEHVTSEILEPISRKRCEFLTSLVTFWVEVVSDRQEGHCLSAKRSALP